VEEKQTLLKQFSIILSIYFLGELLQKTFSLPVPGNVIGMLILFFGLSAGIVKLEMIDKISGFLLDNLAFFFLPAGVSLITCFTLLEGKWTAILEISVLSTVVILAVTGLTVELVKNYLNKGQVEPVNPYKQEVAVEASLPEIKTGTAVNTGASELVQMHEHDHLQENFKEQVS
jgi:holin-like protein